MASSTDVEIGDVIEVTDPQHAWYGDEGKVITKHRGGVGVRLRWALGPVGIYVNDGQFEIKEKEAQGG